MKKGPEKFTVEKYFLNLDQEIVDLMDNVSKKVSVSEYKTKAHIYRAALKIGLSKMLGEK